MSIDSTQTVDRKEFLATASVWDTSPAGGAGTFAFILLWNGVANPKSLVVEEVSALAITAGSQISFGYVGATQGVWSSVGTAKRAGNPAPTYGATYIGSGAFAANLSHIATSTGGDVVWAPKSPIILPPGKGLVIRTNQANVPLQAVMHWYES